MWHQFIIGESSYDVLDNFFHSDKKVYNIEFTGINRMIKEDNTSEVDDIKTIVKAVCNYRKTISYASYASDEKELLVFKEATKNAYKNIDARNKRNMEYIGNADQLNIPLTAFKGASDPSRLYGTPTVNLARPSANDPRFYSGRAPKKIPSKNVTEYYVEWITIALKRALSRGKRINLTATYMDANLFYKIVDELVVEYKWTGKFQIIGGTHKLLDELRLTQAKITPKKGEAHKNPVPEDKISAMIKHEMDHAYSEVKKRFPDFSALFDEKNNNTGNILENTAVFFIFATNPEPKQHDALVSDFVKKNDKNTLHDIRNLAIKSVGSSEYQYVMVFCIQQFVVHLWEDGFKDIFNYLLENKNQETDTKKYNDMEKKTKPHIINIFNRHMSNTLVDQKCKECFKAIVNHIETDWLRYIIGASVKPAGSPLQGGSIGSPLQGGSIGSPLLPGIAGGEMKIMSSGEVQEDNSSEDDDGEDGQWSPNDDDEWNYNNNEF